MSTSPNSPTTATTDGDGPTRSQIRTTVLSASFGNLVEWFDFVTYGLLATTIAAQFFSSTDGGDGGSRALLLTFATFGAGFLARPVGGILIGLYGDRKGRKPALLLSITLMGASTAAIALLPNQAQIGILAPILLVVARLLQGVAAGGEWGGAASFLVEWAPVHRRGLLGSFHTATIFVGTLVASLVIASLTGILGADVMADWGWRVPFAIGGLLALIAIPVRLKAEETPIFRAQVESRDADEAAEVAPTAVHTDTAPHASTMPSTRGSLARRLAFTFCLVAMQSATVYTFTSYFPTFAVKFTTDGGEAVGSGAALAANALAAVVVILVIMTSGALSDRIGRKPAMLVSCLLILVLSYPLVSLAVSADSFAVTVLVQCVLAASVALFLGCLPVVMVELFPARVRVAGLSTSYNLASAVFGGFAPLIAQGLVASTGVPPTMALWAVFAAVISTIAVIFFKETRGVSLA